MVVVVVGPGWYKSRPHLAIGNACGAKVQMRYISTWLASVAWLDLARKPGECGSGVDEEPVRQKMGKRCAACVGGGSKLSASRVFCVAFPGQEGGK